MATTNLNIRTDKAIKDQAEEIFNELGLNMTTAVNIFLRTAILLLRVIPVWMRSRQLSTYEIRYSVYQSV